MILAPLELEYYNIRLSYKYMYNEIPMVYYDNDIAYNLTKRSVGYRSDPELSKDIP